MQATGEHLVGQDTEGPDVGGRPHHCPAGTGALGPPLGRHVVECAERWQIGVGAFEFGGQAEVGEPDGAVRAEEHVGGFEVAVHPAGAVHVGEPGGDTSQDPQGVRDRSARPGGVQRLPQTGLGAVHDERDRPVQRGQVRRVHRAHGMRPYEVRMVRLGAEPCLARDQFTERRTLTGCQSAGRQHLHRHDRAVGDRAGLVHGAPAAGPDDGVQLPAVDPETGRQPRHVEGTLLGA